MTFFFVLFHDRSCGHFLCPGAVTAGPLGAFFYVFVFPLLFGADTPQVFFPWHDVVLKYITLEHKQPDRRVAIR